MLARTTVLLHVRYYFFVRSNICLHVQILCGTTTNWFVRTKMVARTTASLHTHVELYVQGRYVLVHTNRANKDFFVSSINHFLIFLDSKPKEDMIVATSQKLKSKKKKNLSRAEIASVLVLKKANVALNDIVSLVKVSRATVFRVLKASRSGTSSSKNGNSNLQSKKRVGRPRKTTVEMDDFIVKCVEDNRKLVPKQVQKLLFEKFGVTLSLSRITPANKWIERVHLCQKASPVDGKQN